MTTPPTPRWLHGTVDDIADHLRQHIRASGNEYAIAIGLIDVFVVYGDPQWQIGRIRMVLDALTVVTRERAEEESKDA